MKFSLIHAKNHKESLSGAIKLGTSLLWLCANFLGMLAFLWSASSCCWVEPAVADIPGASVGSAFVWIVRAFPIFAVFMLVDLGIVSWAYFSGYPRHPMVWASAIALSGWLGAFVFDGMHHGISP